MADRGDTADGNDRVPSIGLGVLGARSTVARLAVLPAIDASERVHLVAAASLGGPVPERWGTTSVDGYDAVIDHPDVDAVYIPLPNGMHEQWTLRCIEAGKHVLCEKPLAPTPEAAQRMARAADDAGVLLAEAWMTPFAPRWVEALRLASTGLIGDLTEIRSDFTFTIGPEAARNYRWDPMQGGGALLDVGIYCLGPIVAMWGTSPSAVTAETVTSPTGVDAATSATLTFGTDRTATIRCSFVDREAQCLELIGTDGAIVLDGEAHTGAVEARNITFRSVEGDESLIDVATVDPYRAMIDTFAATIGGDDHWPRSVAESIALLELIERIRIAGENSP